MRKKNETMQWYLECEIAVNKFLEREVHSGDMCERQSFRVLNTRQFVWRTTDFNVVQINIICEFDGKYKPKKNFFYFVDFFNTVVNLRLFMDIAFFEK